MLATLGSPHLIINALSVWTGLCWGILLFRLFAPPTLGIKTALGVLLATSFLIMPMFDAFLSIWPPESEAWLEAPSFLARLSGFIVIVGVREEVFKALPVLFALWLWPALRRPRAGVVLGMMAGVGFASTENVYYVYSTLSAALAETKGDRTAFLVPIYNNLVRTMVGPFAHATFSGLMGAFAATGAMRGRVRLILAGLAVSASLHGLYDALVGFSGSLGVAALGLTLFLTILAHAGARSSDSSLTRGDGLFSRTIMRPAPQTKNVDAGGIVPSAARTPMGAASRSVEWFVSVDGRDDVPIPRHAPLRIGRDSTVCEIEVTDPSVSRIHATISMQGLQPQLVRASRVGVVSVNGQQVENAALAEGDVIEVGGTLMKVMRVVPSAPLPAAGQE
ncbi:MAG: PrsW family glutamic-type intramembrane protease [Vicinamibacteria bacterium]